MRNLVAAITVLSVAALPSVAEAHRWNPISAAYTVAARYWHQQPCAGDIRVVVAPPPSNDAANPTGVSTGMWSSWDVGTPYENDESAPQPFHGCVIGINSQVWTSAQQEGSTMWPDFAITMVHEFGHLLGRSHSTDSSSIMFPTPSDRLGITGEYAPGWD